MTQWIDTGIAPSADVVYQSKPPISVKRCRVFDEDTLIHDYEPCRNQDGIRGMYDHVEGKFTTEDEFVAWYCEHLRNADKITISWRGDTDG